MELTWYGFANEFRRLAWRFDVWRNQRRIRREMRGRAAGVK